VIDRKQKMLLHLYADAAGLSDPAYRDQLRHAAGVASAADRTMSQTGFERAMAGLETVLFFRVDAGEVPNPIGRSRWIRSRNYWRGRLPKQGMLNSRHAHRIEQLWNLLQDYLPEEHRHLNYLAGIIRKATGKRDPGYTSLTASEAECLINALKDRLAHALPGSEISNPASQVHDQEPVPF
jgi:hypothetical protein